MHTVLFYAEPRKRAEQRCYKCENSDYFQLAPSAFFEMVVDRSHFEEPLSVGDLEIPDLKHNGERLNYVYDAAYDNYERISRHKCTSDRKSAEIKRTGIAHEYSCGIEVVDKKSRR